MIFMYYQTPMLLQHHGKNHFIILLEGERRIDFVNLPSNCTINIFSMSGKHIKKINRQSVVQYGAESWDLVTED